MPLTPLSIPSPPTGWQIPISFPFFSWTINIHTYALLILAGIIIATVLANRILTRRGGQPWVTVDILIFAIVFGIIGARAWHVATHPADFFPVDGQLHDGVKYDWLHVIAIWDGGGAIFGTLLGGALGVWIGCRIVGIRFLSFADVAAPGLLFAQAIGRIGNYFNHELFGQPTDLPWGLEIESTNPAFPVGLPDGTLFQPMFAYEAILNVIGGVLILTLLFRAKLQWGRAFALYLIWYGVVRGVLEPFRLDPSEIVLGLRVNDWGAIAAVVLGLVILIVQARHVGREGTPYRPAGKWHGPGLRSTL